ncbi:MAG: hypothetical protein GF329_08890 [Candidatus Lokiarchaeota archaeon]|nr:hypothetical protein [Candidatus Lokiarchaeota archaeon]
MSAPENKKWKIIGGILFVIGIALCGIFFYSLAWGTLFYDPSYWWDLVIGIPLVAVGTYLVNKK